MTDKNREALEALDNWIQDADRFIVPFGELTKAEYNLCNHAETIRNALQAQEWQPIETAPRDGTRFLAWQSYEVYECKNVKAGFYAYGFDELAQPTHWMPLPQPPKVKE